MLKKMIWVGLGAILLGGCSLQSYLPGKNEAARDQKTEEEKIIVGESPAPSLSTKTDDASLEADINATIILDEDFSDLE